MKPLYIFLLLYAAAVTFFADGIGGTLTLIPGFGLVLGPAIAFCINATMGAGLIVLLLINGLFHPRFGPFISVGGYIPYVDFLPFWLGLVIMGIIHDMQKNGEPVIGIGGLAKQLSLNYLSGKPPLQQLRGARSIIKNERSATGRVPLNEQTPPQEEEASTRSPRTDLKSPTYSINRDILPRAANDNRPYAQAA